MKLFIENRKKQKMAVLVEKHTNPKGLVFVVHGLNGSKDQVHIKAISGAFKETGYNVISFDATNSLGESYGEPEQATVTNYYQDMEDVISWARSRNWYEEPFILAGHSLGSMCMLLYAEKYPEKIKALAPISTVISGKLSLEKFSEKEIELWKKTGWRLKKSTSTPRKVKRVLWSHMEDRLKYDALKGIDRLTMPVLLIVGENDESTPPDTQKLLYDRLPGKKELHVIEKAPHAFRKDNHLDEVKNIMIKWIKSL